MSEFENNIFDLNGYRNKKLESLSKPFENNSITFNIDNKEVPQKEVMNRIDRIKQSILKINKLMLELRDVAKK